jgi:hypothetical protein
MFVRGKGSSQPNEPHGSGREQTFAVSQLSRLRRLRPTSLPRCALGRRCQATLLSLEPRRVLQSQAERSSALDHDDTTRHPGGLFSSAVTVSERSAPGHVGCRSASKAGVSSRVPQRRGRGSQDRAPENSGSIRSLARDLASTSTDARVRAYRGGRPVCSGTALTRKAGPARAAIPIVASQRRRSLGAGWRSVVSANAEWVLVGV